MKKKIAGILLLTTYTSFSQRVVIKELEKLEPFMTGVYKDKLITPNEEPMESVVEYQFYGYDTIPYQKKVNQLIYDYTKSVAIDTAYIPIAPSLSRQFFKDAVHNFFEGYNYLRFQLNVDDLPPFFFNGKITIDSTSLKNYVQVSGQTYLFTGGAHGNYLTEYHVVNKKTAEKVTWGNLLKDSVAFAKVAEKYFRITEGLSPTDNYDAYFFDNQKFNLSKQFVFTKKGIKLIYLPYEAREWARGFIEVNIPKGKIKKYIKFNW